MRLIKVSTVVIAVLLMISACSDLMDDPKSDLPGAHLEVERNLSGEGVSEYPEISEEIVNNTMYQFFYWDSYPGLWGDLNDATSELHGIANDLSDAGITSVWLPPAAKGMAGGFSVGYDVYDFWDLGEFDQKGTIPTRYGTRAELESAISMFNNLGIDTYYDVVFNHRMGADNQQYVNGFGNVWTDFDLEGRQTYYTNSNWGYLHHEFDWDWSAFNGIDGNLFQEKVGEIPSIFLI